jgi:hypothetical protein
VAKINELFFYLGVAVIERLVRESVNRRFVVAGGNEWSCGARVAL